MNDFVRKNTQLLRAVVLLIALIALAYAADGQAPAQSKEKVYAVFVYNFAANLKWPGPDTDPLVIGVINNESIYNEMTRIASVKKIGGTQIVVKNFTGKDAGKCHVLIVPESSRVKLEQFGSEAVPVYLHDEQAVSTSGIDVFEDKNGKVRFHINQSAIEKQGIQISRSLLSLSI